MEQEKSRRFWIQQAPWSVRGGCHGMWQDYDYCTHSFSSVFVAEKERGAREEKNISNPASTMVYPWWMPRFVAGL